MSRVTQDARVYVTSCALCLTDSFVYPFAALVVAPASTPT